MDVARRIITAARGIIGSLLAEECRRFAAEGIKRYLDVVLRGPSERITTRRIDEDARADKQEEWPLGGSNDVQNDTETIAQLITREMGNRPESVTTPERWLRRGISATTTRLYNLFSGQVRFLRSRSSWF